MRSVSLSGVVLCAKLFGPRLQKTTRGVAALASPQVPSCFFATIAEDDSRGGCFGEPPSVKLLFFRDCGGRLEGWLLWRAPECQRYLRKNTFVIFFLLSLTKSKKGGVPLKTDTFA